MQYHGQFLMAFSGVATALEAQTAPAFPAGGRPAQEDRDRRNRELSPACELINAGASGI